ncbi:hypothetical protein HJG60_010743 [Phyllostomus discolor]|uniref:Uncharacterized protein n=1 Tax=Phyllostomus discolor TaxID=89673 RepID=A0A834AEE6_9CHIR|nr:hypothetical protein HJG60_010743 [Phyllostomus discolor]
METRRTGCGCPGRPGCGPGWDWRLSSAACCPLLAKLWRQTRPREGAVPSVRARESHRWTDTAGVAAPLRAPRVRSWGPTAGPSDPISSRLPCWQRGRHPGVSWPPAPASPHSLQTSLGAAAAHTPPSVSVAPQ